METSGPISPLSTPSADPADRRAVRRVWLARLAAVTEPVLDRHWRETLAVAEYSQLCDSDASGILDTAVWILDAFTRCLEDERFFNVEELERFRTIGADRARQGISISGLKDRFRGGVVQCTAKLAEVAFASSDLDSGEVLTALILRDLMPLAAIAEDSLIDGHAESSSAPTTGCSTRPVPLQTRRTGLGAPGRGSEATRFENSAKTPRTPGKTTAQDDIQRHAPVS